MVGPVEIYLNNSWYANGTIGNPSHPEWLTLHIPHGDFTLNSGSRLDGLVIAPNGRVTVNGNTMLRGGSSSKYFTLNSGGQVIGADLVFPEGGGNENQAPTANAASFTLAEDTVLNDTLTGTDPDGDALIYTLASATTNGELTLNPGGSFSYSPNENFNGVDSFTFTVSDGSITSTSATVSLTITAVNDAPLATAASYVTNEDTAVGITLTGSDDDLDTLVFSIVTIPSHGTLSGTAPDFTYTPDADFDGTDSFTFTVNDGTETSASATISLTIHRSEE
ncbi:MAG: cadherin-like domain-containing protein, partial [Puniceicoccales bacterium]